MNPNFKDRDIVLSINYPRSLKNNDVVLLDLPNYGVVIKRIKSINGDDLKLAGDNKKYSSPIYKNIYKKENILGKVIFRF
jgi:signal peptidase I